MTSLPPLSQKKLGLVIDLDTCVGCHACAVNCKEWNTAGTSGTSGGSGGGGNIGGRSSTNTSLKLFSCAC